MSDTYLPNRAGRAAFRVDALKSRVCWLEDETVRLAGVIGEALDAMGDPERSNAAILCDVHAILSRAMADHT